MLDWRTPIADLRYEISDAKRRGVESIPLTNFESVINAIESNLAVIDKYEILRQGNKNTFDDSEEAYQRNLDRFSKALSTAAERHKNYTQLIVSAGYAAYFGLWSITGDLLKHSTDQTINLMRISVVYVLISVLSFILLEVINIGIEGYEIQIKNEVLFKVKLENHKNYRSDAFEASETLSAYANNMFHKIWCWSYPISVIFGLGGIGLLFAALLK